MMRLKLLVCEGVTYLFPSFTSFSLRKEKQNIITGLFREKKPEGRGTLGYWVSKPTNPDFGSACSMKERNQDGRISSSLRVSSLFASEREQRG